MSNALIPLRRFWCHQRVQVVMRLLLVATFAAALVLGVRAGGAGWAVAALSGAGLLAQIVALVRYTDQTQRDVLHFLESIRYDDFSTRFQDRERGALYTHLATAFESVSEAFRQVRAEREEHAQYLQAVVRHVGVALIAFRSDGRVTLLNTAARRLLQVSGLGTIEALYRIDETLARTIGALEPGRRALIRLRRAEQTLELVAFATSFQLGGDLHTLISLQDIQPELEEKENEAWQQLTRVLTHEIMNSIAPITSLAGTAQEALRAAAGTDRDTACEALSTIQRRGEGLMGFVEAYRSLTRVPQPHLRLLPVEPLFAGILTLMRTSASAQGVSLSAHVTPESLEVAADGELIEQVLINLTINALQALEGRGGTVTLRAETGATGRPVLSVTDDGPGILPEVLERIFVPFFTTKPGGSGIGLSLSRQIMRRHGGTLTVRSIPGEGSTFSLHF